MVAEAPKDAATAAPPPPPSSEAAIDAAEVDALVRAACAAAVPYPAQLAASPAKLDAASAAIAEGVVKRLAALGGGGGKASAAPRHKFVVSVHLSQASGAGLHVAAAHRLDPRTDGRVVVAWQGGGGGGGGGAGGTGGEAGGGNGNANPDAPPAPPAPAVIDALVTVFYVAI